MAVLERAIGVHEIRQKPKFKELVQKWIVKGVRDVVREGHVS